jgi:hypothetical protein
VGHVACPDIEPITVAMVEPSVEDKPLDVGVAGASARQVADRQHAKRVRAKQGIDDATHRAHPRIGNLLVKVRDIVAELEKPSSWRRRSLWPSSGASKLDRRWPPKIDCASQAGEGSSRALDRPDMEHRWGDLVA